MLVVWNREAAVKGMRSRLIKYNLGSFHGRTCCWTGCGVKEKEKSKIHNFKIFALNKQRNVILYQHGEAWNMSGFGS